ncbi:hypothetical protein LEMLEM_LOCUS21334 [Lemmus lemmus]
MVRLEAVRSSPEGARAPAPHHRLIYSLRQAGHVLRIHIALHFTTMSEHVCPSAIWSPSGRHKGEAWD